MSTRLLSLARRAAVLASLALAACGGGGGDSAALSPSLTGISPASCPAGGGTAVTLTGTGFQVGATVAFGGSAGTAVAVASATAITATCPARAAGPASVVVTNADGQSAALTGAFTYRNAPTITSVTPAAGSPLGGALVTIAGIDFATSPAPTVTFGAVAAPLVGSAADSLTVTAPAHAAGAVDVTVTNGDGEIATRAAAFTFQTLPPPALTQLSATVGSTAGGDPVTLTGTGLSPPVVVTFGGAQVPAAAQSTTSAVVQSPPAAAGPVTVTLTNSDGQVSNGLTFTYQVGTPPPAVGSVSPASGSSAGGRTVSIAGSNFSASPASPRVSFGGEFATVVTATATLIIATVPAHAPGTVAVAVTNPDAQSSTRPSAFTYVAPPVLASLHPTSGSTGGGEQIDLTGTSFDVGTTPVVTFGLTPAHVATGSTATAITVITPPHGEGAVDVTVTNGDGQASTLANGFTYDAPAANAPTVRNVTNDATGLPSGGVAGGEAVTLTGTNFAPGATVLFGAAPATHVAFVSTTTLTATTPLAQPAGTVDVTVALPGTGLAGTILRGFTFLLAAPQVTTFSVNSSQPAGGGLLLVKGSNLQASSRVTFGGIKATVTEFMPGVPPGGDVLTAIIPPSPLLPGVIDGFVSVVVQNPDGQSSTLAPSVSPDGTPWPANFHYGPPPVVTGFSPSTGRGLDVTLTGTGFSSDATGARAGLQVLFSGPSFDILRIRRCPNAADPACPAGLVSPTPTSLVVTIPSGQLLPGNYGFVVTNFDGQSAMAPGAFVVP